jgi:2-oxoglutarate ferredoxin oxidoreductase subunit alpha
MRHREVTVGIGGAAGDGSGATGDNLAKVCSRLGLHVFAYNSYQSIIRGGHVWLRLRIAEQKVMTHGDHLNLLIALNQDTLDRHAAEVHVGGGILYNSDRLKVVKDDLQSGVSLFGLPIRELTQAFGRQTVVQNTAALGALFWLLSLDYEMLESVLRETFGARRSKDESVVETNLGVARASYQYAQEHFAPSGFTWQFTGKQRLVVSGNELFGLGALAAGCKFYAAYPMAPSTAVLHWLASHAARYNIVVKQCEDEIAVLNMVVGAAHAGVRAMCATSGGGFSLMTEAVGLAGMTETPVVVINVQRGGPSTGLPTKTEQADLNQLVGASQGDYPRAILAPVDLVDCYYAVIDAFNLAEKYQCPVLIASDLLLSEHRESADPEDFDFNVPIERGALLTNGEANGEYKRFAFTESGISPRALPGTEGTAYVAASDEHDETGVLISDEFTNPEIRVRMMEKRMRKMEGLLKDCPPPQLYGPADADVTLIGWGSTQGVIREAIADLETQGIRANNLQIRYLVPFHEAEVYAILQASKRTLVVENNYTGQLARHIRAETGFTVHGKILKYDGEPFEPHHIVAQVKEILHGNRR